MQDNRYAVRSKGVKEEMAPATGRCAVDVGGERLELLPDKAVLWPRAGTLFVADLHLGKASSFRAASLPLPCGSGEDTLVRLTSLLRRAEAVELVILGDLWHSREGRTERELARFEEWRECHAHLPITLVQRNHDRRSGLLPPELRIEEVEEPLIRPPFALRHYPEPCGDGYVLSGHLHPAVTLDGAGGQSLRLSCFWFSGRVGVLPAFGSFTGSASVVPRRGDKVFVVADGEVLQVGG